MKKNKKIENLVDRMISLTRKEAIEKGICVVCRKQATEFTDEISKHEFTIVALCQRCQDDVYGPV